MTGNTTPNRMTWGEQAELTQTNTRALRKIERNKQIRDFLGDLVGVAAIATIFVCFLVFTA